LILLESPEWAKASIEWELVHCLTPLAAINETWVFNNCHGCSLPRLFGGIKGFYIGRWVKWRHFI